MDKEILFKPNELLRLEILLRQKIAQIDVLLNCGSCSAAQFKHCMFEKSKYEEILFKFIG